MAPVILFHSALGLTPDVVAFADDLRALGHDVTTPDYYAGRTFDAEAPGIAYRDEVGIPELMKSAATALDGAPSDAVLAGFSLGAFFAQAFAAKRPDARAAVLLHSVAKPRGDWSGVPVQLHRHADDPWIDAADVEALADAVRACGAPFEDIVVPGRGHLFTHLSTPDGDADARAESLRRMHAFISG